MSNSSKNTNVSSSPSGLGGNLSPYWGLGANEFFRSLASKPIKLAAMDGKLYSGTLVGVDQYDLFVRQTNGLTLMFPKHSIKFLHADGTSPSDAKEKKE